MASGNTLATMLPQGSEPPSSNYATFTVRNGILVADFDASTIESLIFRGILPAHYAGGGLTIDIFWFGKTATSGDVIWTAAMERDNDNGDDLDSDSFATGVDSSASTTNGTSGKVNKTSIALTSGAQMDSLAAGESFRLKISRKASDGSDTMSGDAQLLSIHVKET